MANDLKVLFPGREITIQPFPEPIVIFPLGISHMSKFNAAIEGLIPRIAVQVDISSIGSAMKDLLPMITPILLGECLDLVNECVVGLDLKDPLVPHWILPQIIDVWVEESFVGEGKIQPWIQAIESIIAKVTGKEIGISEMLSNSLSAQGTN